MSDLFELQLSLDLPSDLTDDELQSLRWHLGTEDRDPPADMDDPDYWPLFCDRGPATRIGSVVAGDLQHGRRGCLSTSVANPMR